MKVVNTYGASDAATVDVNSVDFTPIIENLTESTDGLKATLSANFSAQGPGAKIKSVIWNFGDGSVLPYIDTRDFDKPVMHTYRENGTSTVKVTAIDVNGRSTTQTINVSVEKKPMDLDFTYDCNPMGDGTSLCQLKGIVDMGDYYKEHLGFGYNWYVDGKQIVDRSLVKTAAIILPTGQHEVTFSADYEDNGHYGTFEHTETIDVGLNSKK